MGQELVMLKCIKTINILNKYRNVCTVNKNKSIEHVTDHILRYDANHRACCMYTIVFMGWHSIVKWAIVGSASHRGQTGSCSPSNNAACVKRISQIPKRVTATSLLLKLKEDCHMCTDRLTTRSLLSCVWVYFSC